MGRKSRLKEERRLERMSRNDYHIRTPKELKRQVASISEKQFNYCASSSLRLFERGVLKGVLTTIYKHPVTQNFTVEYNLLPNKNLSKNIPEHQYECLKLFFCKTSIDNFYDASQGDKDVKKYNYATLFFLDSKDGEPFIRTQSVVYNNLVYYNLKNKEQWMVANIERIKNGKTLPDIMWEFENKLHESSDTFVH